VNTLSYKTVSANKATAKKEWVIVDASNQILGRLSSKVAQLLRGKLKTNFTPHVDCGDNVIIINAEKIKMTGKKWTDRVYFTHSGYPGGQRVQTPEEITKKNPAKLIEIAIRRMLPKNKLGHELFRNLKVYAGDQHPHGAQNPKNIDLNSIK
jgi:large subunit ribosomal protein L13